MGDLLERFGKSFAAGTILFREGDVGTEMYVINSGRVRLTRRRGDKEMTLVTLPAGEFFGEMAIVNNRPRTATAEVVEDARLLVIDSRTFEAMIRGRTEIAVRIIKAMAARLEQANQQIDLLLVRDANHRVVQALRRLAEVQGAGDALGAGVYINLTADELAAQVGLDEATVTEVVGRLQAARLVVAARDAGYDADGFLVPEVGRLVDFLEFLEMKERFGP